MEIYFGALIAMTFIILGLQDWFKPKKAYRRDNGTIGLAKITVGVVIHLSCLISAADHAEERNREILFTLVYYGASIALYFAYAMVIRSARRLKEWRNKKHLEWVKSDKGLLARAQSCAMTLNSVLPDEEWDPLRNNCKRLVSETLPKLLSYRREMKDAIRKSEGIIDLSENDPRLIGQAFKKKATGDVAWFNDMLRQTEERISESISILLHMETDLMLILGENVETVRQSLNGHHASIRKINQE